MEKMNDLKDLLKHEILDLYSAEEQIIEALPLMIEKAQNKDLKKALTEHLKITEEQKKRLDKIKKRFSEEGQPQQGDQNERKGFFSRLFSGMDETQKCKGMEGLIDEGKKVMGEDMSPEALDAAIIGCAQKIEHYEISGYGTAKAYAKELQLNDVEKLLENTLSEEYEADDRLTELAVGRLNKEAEQSGSDNKMQDAMTESGEETRPNRKESPGKNTTAKKSGGAQAKKKENAPARSSANKESKSSKANNKEKTSKADSQKKGTKSSSASAKAKKSARSKSTTKSR